VQLNDGSSSARPQPAMNARFRSPQGQASLIVLALECGDSLKPFAQTGQKRRASRSADDHRRIKGAGSGES
jgi:hypothetical protein